MAKATNISIDNTSYEVNDAAAVKTINIGSTPYTPSSGVVNLPNYPSMPTVNNGVLTIQKNGTNVQTFSANQSTNATANITVPTKTSDITNDSGYITSSAVNNGVLTIQKNGSNVQTFSANQSTNATANITVPTKTSELTNDSGYITNAGVTGVKGNSEGSYRSGNVNLTAANIGAAPTSHAASSASSYGAGDTSHYGHVKTYDGYTSDSSDKSVVPTLHGLYGLYYAWANSVAVPKFLTWGTNTPINIFNNYPNSAVMFSNWTDGTNFPSLYGSGIILPAADVNYKYVLYIDATPNMYFGMWVRSGSSVTRTWRKISYTNV